MLSRPSPSLFLSNHIFSHFSSFLFLCPTSYHYLALTLNTSLSLCLHFSPLSIFLILFPSFFFSVSFSQSFLSLSLSISLSLVSILFLPPHHLLSPTLFLAYSRFFFPFLFFSVSSSHFHYLFLFLWFLFRSYYFPLYLPSSVNHYFSLFLLSFLFLLLALSVYAFISPILLPCFFFTLSIFFSLFVSLFLFRFRRFMLSRYCGGDLGRGSPPISSKITRPKTIKLIPNPRKSRGYLDSWIVKGSAKTISSELYTWPLTTY